MARKKSKEKVVAAKPEGAVFEVGTPVRIIRPALWSGASGIVVSVKDGLHRVKIAAKPENGIGFFHADCYGDVLEMDL